ncbi:MAG: DUF4159 domain-containing protein [Planctomycetales bacterium]|nr:DUF4159 domain-containing protein [Planctomycetales bacterium]
MKTITCARNSRALLLLVATIVACPRGWAQQSDSEKVDNAIKQAVRYLLTNQQPDGGWPEIGTYPLGVSCLVTLSLLNSGLPPESPVMMRALQRIESRDLEKTYTVALQTMALCAANPNRYASRIQRNAQWLLEAQRRTGGWSYGKAEGGENGDPSNAQFALLALHEAQRSGVVQLPENQWRACFQAAKRYWQQLQNGDGSFPYNAGEKGRGSMTCAGIASLIIVGTQLDSLEATVADDVRCCGASESEQDRIDQALEWLGRNFSSKTNPGHSRDHLYYLYAVERTGRLTGQRFIGPYDWYREGASELILLQDPVTGQVGARATSTGGNTFSETAFALLFLSKGKRQIVVSRLKYGPDDDWNHHATAIQNLTAHTERAWKRDLAWQTIDLRKATVKDLLESPVLFLSGTGTPAISDAQKQVLRDYVQQGGFLFAEGCVGNGCNGQAFETYFRKLVVELFEQPLEKISPDHPIWYAESRIRPQNLPEGTWLWGVQTCCRLGVVYCPSSLSCRWELNPAYGLTKDYPESISGELNAFTKIGLNVLAYATGKELKEKLDTVTILENDLPETTSDRGVLFLPILQHSAGADDAPKAVPTLMQWFWQELPQRLSSEKRMINIAEDDLSEYPISFMHGRGKLRLSDGQRQALKSYFENGGFLFANAICADQEFMQSFRTEMEIILGVPLQGITPDHDILTSKNYHGFDIRRVQMIDPDRSGDQIVTARREITPRLELGKFEDRVVVVFSPLDISCALESRHSLQCQGYLREDAAKIGINVLLYALQQ